MNVEQMKQRVAEIQAKLAEFDTIENFSDNDVASINALNEEFATLKTNIEAKEKLEVMKANTQISNRKVAPTIEVKESASDRKHGFENAGEFFKAVASASQGNMDRRLAVYNTAMNTNLGEDGGFLIPTDFRTEIQKKIMGDESLLVRTRQFQTASNQIVLPVSEIAPWEGTGIQAYWTPELGTYNQSKTKFGQAVIRLHKLTALIPVSEELLEDALALESFIRMEAPQAIMHKINSALISGDGIGKPQGFLNSGFKVRIAKEAGPQTADTVIFENIVKMQAAMLPSSFAKSVWLVNPEVLPQLRLMAFKSGVASPVPAYMPPAGLAEAPYGTLMGRPIIPMMGGVKALGDEGDISLVDLSYLYTAVKVAGIKSDVSTHVYFDRDEVLYKFSTRIGGLCPFQSPLTPEFGTMNMSGFITLEAR